MKALSILILGAALPASSWAMGEDDPLLFMFKLDKFEVQDADSGSTPLIWEGSAWLGKDLNKLYLKTEGERVGGEYEELSTELLYSRAISPYWDVQTGWRHDSYPKPTRDWFAIGLQGLAPYYFETDASLYIGSSGRLAASLSSEYEWMLTQRWVLSPEAELNFYSKDDPETHTGSGLSNTKLGLRLRYEFRREFAPYIGVEWNKKFGQTADYAREEGSKTETTRLVAGVRLWF